MTPARFTTAILSSILLSGLAACGGSEVRTTCDEPQPYQAVVPGQRIIIPEDLDGLDEYKEMPIPTAQTPPRPAGSQCIDYPPAIR